MSIENLPFNDPNSEPLSDVLVLIKSLESAKKFDLTERDLPQELANTLRRIPSFINDVEKPEYLKDDLVRRFQNLPQGVIDRIVCIDFASHKDLRVFPSQIEKADFSDQFAFSILERMKYELHATPYLTEDIFDLAKMDKDIKKSDEEEEEDDKLEAEGDERKAMSIIVERAMVPMNAPLYKQLMNGTQVLVDANGDVNKIDSSVLLALPLIEELGKRPNEIWYNLHEQLRLRGIITSDTQNIKLESDEVDALAKWEGLTGSLEDIDINTPEEISDQDGQSERWTNLIKQLIELDTTTREWQRLLRQIKDLQDKAGNLIAKLERADPESGEWIELHQSLRELHPKGIFFTGDFLEVLPSVDDIANEQAGRDRKANMQLDEIFAMIKEPAQPLAQKLSYSPPVREQQAQQKPKLKKRIWLLYENIINKKSNDEIIEYLNAHKDDNGGVGFIANVYRQVSNPDYGVSSLRDNQRSNIEAMIAKEEFDIDNN